MDYTLGTLKSILRKKLQDEDFNDDLLADFINQAQSEILGEDKYPFMQRIDEYTTIGNSGEIMLPLGYAGTFFLYAEKPKQPKEELHYAEPEKFFENIEAHHMSYTVFANRLYYKLYKGDDTACKGAKITHLYLINPAPMIKDTDRSFIPGQYIEALILGAMYRAEQYRDNFDYAQIYQNQQDQILTNMKLRYGPGNLSAQNRAKLPYFGGYADDRN